MSAKEKIILGAIGLLIVIIPTTSYFIAKNRTQLKSNAQDNSKFTPLPITSPREVPKTNGRQSLSDNSATGSGSTEEVVPPILGPTMDFKIIIEARPSDNQTAKLFVGIAAGDPSNNPNYILSFIVNVPATGEYKGLSLAGLEEGSSYTAYLKGPAQIATASAFVVNPTPTNLGTFNLITGDVNEDNVINDADFNILRGGIGTTPNSPSWNANLDFNLDNIVNSWDLSYISKNMSRTGDSGVWYSKPPVSTSSGSLIENLPRQVGAPDSPAKKGFWMWFPPI